MIELPALDEAARQLSEFLASLAYPKRLAWALPCDYYSLRGDRHRVRWPLPCNRTTVEENYEAARSRGIAALEALFFVDDVSVVTLDTPNPEEIQGWNQGLKLCIRQPFVAGEPISRGRRWAAHQRSHEYRESQRYWRELAEYRTLQQTSS